MFNFKDDFIILKVCYFKKRKLVFSVSSKIFFVATTKQVGGGEGGLGGRCFRKIIKRILMWGGLINWIWLFFPKNSEFNPLF